MLEAQQTQRVKVGRPRGFDRDVVLMRVAELFDRHGYEGLSVADLALELDLSHPSLYAAFGPKPVLYRMAPDAYAARWTEAARDALAAEDLKTALATFLRRQIQAFRQDGRRLGCMLSAALQTSAEDHALEARHATALRTLMARILRDRLDRGVRDGDLPVGADTRVLASCFAGLLHGLSTLARDGADMRVLEQFAEAGLKGLSIQAATTAERRAA